MSRLVAFVAATLEMSVPLGLAALGGTVSERAGVANIALEGILLGSAFAAVASSVATGSALVGAIAGALAGALLGAVHGAFVLRGRVDAIVSGLALNLVAAGGTRALLRALYRSSANSPDVRGFSFAPEASGSLVRVIADPLFWIFVVLAVALARAFRTTRFGLWVRASGDDPRAAYAAGVPVLEVRFAAVVAGSAITGLGGVALAFSQHQFQAGMSGGRGFIALAAVIVSGWRPRLAALACLAFAALEAAGFVLQDRGGALPAAFAVLPYAGTLAVLFLFARGGTFRAPKGMGVLHDD